MRTRPANWGRAHRSTIRAYSNADGTTSEGVPSSLVDYERRHECQWLYIGYAGFDTGPWQHGTVTYLVVPPDSRFCDECRWNYILLRSRLRVRIPSAPSLGGRSSMGEREFHHSLSSHLFQAANALGTTLGRGFESRQPQGCSSVGRANVPITSSLHGGPPPPFLLTRRMPVELQDVKVAGSNPAPATGSSTG